MSRVPVAGEDHPGNFDAFYDQQIAPHVDEYNKRGRAGGKVGGISISLLLLSIAGFVILFKPAVYPSIIWIIPFLLLGATMISSYFYFKKEGAVTSYFKEKIVTVILQHLLPGASIKHDTYMSSKLYEASGLYRQRYDLCDGNDLIKGSYKQVVFKASELKTGERKRRSINKIFSGIFMAATIPAIQGGTYIWPRQDLQVGEQFRHTKPLHRVFKVPSGSDVFNKYFEVYSSYPAEAAALLTQDRMQGMINLKYQLKKKIRYSFVAGRFYACIENEDDLLEPLKDLADRESVKSYFFMILVYPAIINQLKLYEYI